MTLHAGRYYFLCDDAYIAFRYAKNLAAGRGLVFNVGEHVEGYTSVLWTLQMAVGEFLGASSERGAPFLGITYTIGSLAMYWKLVRSHRGPGRELALGVTAGLLSINRTWAVWTTGGLETRSFSFFVLAAVYCVWTATRESDGVRRDRWLVATSVALACAVFSRPDALVDILGLTDAEVAHRGMRREGRFMAHDPSWAERRSERRAQPRGIVGNGPGRGSASLSG